MFSKIRFRIFLPAALCVWAFLATGCTQPLGPGFHFAERQTEIRVSPRAPELLHIRVADHFDNVGNFPLRSLEVRLPEGPNSGSQNLRMTIDGKEVSPARSSDVDRRLMRAVFDPAWKEQQPREIVTEWDMMPEPSTRSPVAASAAAFYVADETVLPLWQPPNGFLTAGGPDPADEILTVSAPADFRVLAPGKPFKRRNSVAGNLVAQSFHIMPAVDFPPYVVAGRYQEQVVDARQGAVSFWTFQPLGSQQARTAAARLSSSMRAFTDFFGPSSKGKIVVHIAEVPGELPDDFGALNGPDPGGSQVEYAYGGTSFPEGALLDSRAFARGVANEAVLQLAEYELARTWFGWRVRPRPEAQILMGRGVGLFGLIIAAETRGQGDRERMAAALVERYDEARRIAADRRLLEPPAGYSRAERVSTGYKAALFIVALEDLCGHDNLRSAFRDITQARGNDDVGYEELRAAVESASRRDLAEIFRVWLIRPGIPDNFRVRYSKPANAQRGD